MERDSAAVDRSLEGRDPGLDQGSQSGLEGGLKELVLRWFTETQAATLTQDGHFPDWFQGFATRKEAEEQLEDKAVGVFLIRLSEKAIGYILSYKGEDRCRHFVITRSHEGQFSIAGDEQEYPSLSALIEHHKVCPIQPFGEYLTHSEQEAQTDLYDVVRVQTKVTSGVSVQALRSLWDQKGAPCREIPLHAKSLHLRNNTEQVPALPPKTSKRLIGSLSMDTTELSRCIEQQAISLGFLPANSSPDPSHPQNSSTPRDIEFRGEDQPQTSPGTAPSPATYSSVVHPENRTRSLPCLDHEDESSSEAMGTRTLATRSKKVTSVIHSLPDPRDGRENMEEDVLKSNPLYEPVRALQQDSPYAEVQERGQKVDSPYEDIDRPERDRDSESNAYESIEAVKSKRSKTKEWRSFFTDYLKKSH